MIKHRLGLIFIIVTLFLVGCESLKYSDDLRFLNSAVANSPELYISINGKMCKDMEGKIGLCSKRIKSNETVKITFEKQPYVYTVHVQCSNQTGIDYSRKVLTSEQFLFEIKPSQYSTLRMFTCLVEVQPDDRAEGVSALAEIRFMVVDYAYVPREEMRIYSHKGKDYLVLGANAKHSIVYETNQQNQEVRKTYKEKTILRINNNRKKIRAFSESFSMRINSIDSDSMDVR